MNFVNPYIFLPPPNTFIGGVSSVWSTPALLAGRLGISVTRIKNFSVIGSNIQCSIVGGSYGLPSNFCDVVANLITYYNDPEGLVNSILNDAFRSTSVLPSISFKGVTSLPFEISRISTITNYDFPNCLTIGNVCWSNVVVNANVIINIPKCTSLGSTVGNNKVFAVYGSSKFKVTVPIALQTANAGAADGDLVAVLLRPSSTVTYV